MMALHDQNYVVRKATDKKHISAFKKVKEENSLTITNSTISTIFGTTVSNQIGQEFDLEKTLTEILSKNSEHIKVFNFNFRTDDGKSSLSINLNRGTDHDNIKMTGNGFTEQQASKYLNIITSVRKHFTPNDSTKALTELPKQIEQHYQVREAELTKLEEISKALIYDQEQYRIKLEQNYINREIELSTKYDDKINELKIREDALADERKKIDDSASKHARRALRDSLKKIFHNRGQKFELSAGTIELRKPIGNISIFLIAILALLFTLSILASFQVVGSIDKNDWFVHIKQFALALSFGGMTLFYIKWQNRWFEKHSSEEFMLKRQEIDIDRASWAVELAIEWRQEHEADIPHELLQILTKNLFEYNDNKTEPKLHPADELASAILGSSAGINLKLPNGSEVKLDKKGIESMSK